MFKSSAYDRKKYINELLALISSIKRNLRGRTYACDSGYELSGAQLGLLFVVKHNGPLSAQEAAKQLSMSAGAVSQLVDSLVNHGLLERTNNPKDRRLYALSLTKVAIKHTDRIEQERYELFSNATAGMTKKELEVLITVHRKILNILQNETKSKERK